MVSNALETLEPPVLIREKAFERVRDAIIAGRLAPGARLIERELCEALGVSRASVREVIRRLEAERLVVVEPRRGPTVVKLTPEQAAEIYEIRAMLESLLIKRVAERANDADLAVLEDVFERLKRAAAIDAVQDIVKLMRQFNAHLVAIADHRVAGDLLAQLDARISWLRVQAMATPGRLRASVDEISAVLKLVRRREAQAAAERIAASVANARDAALQQIASAQATPAKKRRKPS